MRREHGSRGFVNVLLFVSQLRVWGGAYEAVTAPSRFQGLS
jgi:hypothetical protein